jgi:hypothetical protein
MTTTVFEGVVRGRVVELDHESGLPQGQRVSVSLQAEGKLPPSPADAETLARLKSAARLSADESKDLDKFLEWSREQRKRDRSEIEP